MKRKLLAVILLVILLFAGCSTNAAPVQETSFDQASLGVVTGSLYDGYSRTLYPNATIDYYNSFADLFQCIKQEKIDAFMLDEAAFNAVHRTDLRLQSVVVPEYCVELGFGFQKNDGGDLLQAQMNELLDSMCSDGSMDAMIDKWYGIKEPDQTLQQPDFSDNTTPLTVAIDTTRKPFVYLLNNQPAGLEVEVLYLFCETYGYRPTFTDVPFASGLAGLSGEKYDLVCGGLYMTAERKQSVNFSDPYMTANVVMVTYQSLDTINVYTKIAEAFSKTILKEYRWKLILSGMLTTFLLSTASIVAGSGLGFAVFLGKRTRSSALSVFCRAYSKIFTFVLRGTPTLVLLMLLYYSVFGRSSANGIFVSILGFAIIVSSFVEHNLTRTVDAVDRGQTEAAYALGYNRSKTLFKIVLPQAMKLFLPMYSEEIISIIKATSIVGYIAVNDLTKTADIIRSNTFIALFPLLAATVCYFILTYGAAGLLRLIQKRTDPKFKRQRRIGKGEAA